MAKRYDVVATIEYEKKDGTAGKSYVRCGSAFEGDKGISIKLDSVPVSPDWNGWLSLYEPREEGARKPASRDEVPF